jgi:hypothetical protein
MSENVKKTIDMLELLPETEQNLAYEFIKRLVKAWDPDYTKLTPSEEKNLKEAMNDEFILSNEIDWDDLDNIL